MTDITATPPIVRWAVKIEYDGTGLVGWQRQNNGISVQELLENAAARMIGGQIVPSVTAGRTDAGVHAASIVVHLDFPAGTQFRSHQIRDGLSFHLKPHRVVVLDAAPVGAEWSARFSALWRRYRFTILNRPSRAALMENHAWHVKRPLNAELMQKGADYLLGRHDFSSFRASACQANSPMRTLDELSVRREGELIFIETQARSFLHHQVRNMVGSLALVGYGQWEPDKMGEVLAACDRRVAGPTAPSDGLCFLDVGYEENPFSKNS
ncbi:tRNA pseudouridine(38-40) synthase TruA [Neokomagataea tanensis]|uniref:tRNA pseudouridine synthase A n=1 Tax=Neokomagataea tanensis TaxID=661191 RepID=A0A4Y6V651_9PROT|nr:MULTISPECIES: tRNA pseudouridine(38-40) synthase TruA [Neokomagataea]QDH24844.1 tRNA pseudouridine(38-40) synthase TruA [Neokomagataea tanensis]